MLTEQEKQIMDRAKASGKTFEQAMGEIAMSRKSMGTAVFDDERPLSNKITDALGLGKAVDVFGTEIARAFAPAETRGYIEPNKPGQLLGATMQTAAIPIGAAFTGGTSLAGQMAAGAAAGYLYDVGSDLAENKSVTEAITPGMGTATGLLVPPALKGVVGVGNIIAGAGKTAIGAAKTAFPGVTQTVTDGLERFPRAIGKGKEALGEAALRSERIRTATPVVQSAIKSGLDDVVIDAVSNADEPTKQAYRKMVEIAEAPREGLRPAVRPESVAGDAVAEQYKILNTQRQTIGQQIGDAVDKLSTKGALDVLPSQRTMRDLLRQNGILPDISGKLNFSGSSLTPKQQTLVQQIYEISTQSEKMTPRQIYNMDKLFSQLQREARFDGLDNVYLKTPEGDMNVYRLFRNIFSNQLDVIAPEIAPLNKQYAQLRNLQDDIEASIVKRGNFESTRNVDAAEFAQTNLRRAFSDAASAADYRALADKLDAYARANGYTGANALDLAGFATRLRQIYPETVPETSATGILSGGIKGILGKIMDIGAPDTVDKQRALKALLDFDGGGIPPTINTGGFSSLEAEAKGKTLEEFVKAQGTTLYHGGTKIDEVGAMRSRWKAFYMSDDPTYAKSYGGSKSVLNEIVLSPEAKLADLRNPSEELVAQLDQMTRGRTTGKTFNIQKPDGTYLGVPEVVDAPNFGSYTQEQVIEGIRNGKAHFAEEPAIKEVLKKLGYDGMITQESKYGANYGVWNKDVLKTRSQLTEIWKKANGME